MARLRHGSAVAVGKPSLKGRLVISSRPETGRAIHGQGEGRSPPPGGPNGCPMQRTPMTCG